MVSQGARIAGLDGSSLGGRFMLDVSRRGARLKVRSPKDLPNEVVLLRSRDGKVQRRCLIAWRSVDEIGVRFIFEKR
jgi:hypothetical protein